MILFLLILVLLFKDPQVWLAALLPAAFASVCRSSCQTIKTKFWTLLWCGDVTVWFVYLWERAVWVRWQTGCGQWDKVDAHRVMLSSSPHGGVIMCRQGGWMRWGDQRRAAGRVLISRIHLLLDRCSAPSTVTYLEMCERYFWGVH